MDLLTESGTHIDLTAVTLRVDPHDFDKQTYPELSILRTIIILKNSSFITQSVLLIRVTGTLRDYCELQCSIQLSTITKFTGMSYSPIFKGMSADNVTYVSKLESRDRHSMFEL